MKAAGKPAELLVGEGYNHFEMLETLANPYGLLGRAALAQMRLDAGVTCRYRPQRGAARAPACARRVRIASAPV